MLLETGAKRRERERDTEVLWLFGFRNLSMARSVPGRSVDGIKSDRSLDDRNFSNSPAADSISFFHSSLVPSPICSSIQRSVLPAISW